MANFKSRRYNNEVQVFDVNSWEPVTQIGKMVKERSVTSVEQIFSMGKNIEEVGIVEALLPGMKSEVIEIKSVQRMTRNNRKQKYRVTSIVGDSNGHVGVGIAKDVEVKAAIDSSIKNAKMNIMPVIFGCGSWQCTCGKGHSLPFTVQGKCGSVEVILKPAPRGLGVAASRPVRMMLELAGVKDIWSFSRGRTRTKFNTLMAVSKALSSTLQMKNLKASNIAEVK